VFGARPRADRHAVGTKPVLDEFALAVGADFTRAETAGVAMTGKFQILKFNAGRNIHGGAPLTELFGSPGSIPVNMLHRSIFTGERIAAPRLSVSPLPASGLGRKRDRTFAQAGRQAE